MFLAVVLALASAGSFATGSALQHRAAGNELGGKRIVARLVRRPSWIIGLVLSGLAFLLHALALRHGDLALVQPVIVSGIVFAVLIRSGLAHRFPPPRRTTVWLVLTCAGLALFLGARPATTDQTANLTKAVVVVAAGGALALVATLVALRWATVRNKGILLATATGTLYGLVAGLVKLALASGNDMLSVLTSWPIWALVAAGTWAVFLNQRAYQSARLWVTAPIVSIGEALVSILFGIVVFDEVSRSSAVELLGQGLGLALVIAGVIKLASTQDDEEDRSVPPETEVSSLVVASPDPGLRRG